MPLLSRPDGELVRDEAPVRLVMPYLMKGRNESVIYHRQLIDITRTRDWLRAYNRAGPRLPASMFVLLMWHLGRGLHRWPQLNRFVSGGRLYQRNHVTLSFAAKKKLNRQAPFVAVKIECPPDDSLGDHTRRAVEAVQEARSAAGTFVEKELELAMRLPHPLRRLLLGCIATLDRFNALPSVAIRRDPMFTSVFLAHLGSIGLDNTYHHLYEYGTCSIFGVVGAHRRVSDASGTTRYMLELRWTLDERIIDGFNAGVAMRELRRGFENPESRLGAPERAAADG